MAAVRPYWKGYIKLALVSCPIALYTASTDKDRVAFRQINKKTGNRIRQQLIDEETRLPVEADDKGRGFEYDKGAYLLIEDEELDGIEIESNHTIDIDSFVLRTEIDERYLDSPYFIAPSQPVGQEAFAVIREAMRARGMVALGRVVVSKRERVIMLQPWEQGMLGMTLRYPYEVRDAKDYFYDIPDVKIEPELLTLAQHILKSKEARFDPAKFVDRYEQAVLELIEKKKAGAPAAPARSIAAPQNVVNLFEAFRLSLANSERENKVEKTVKKAAAPKKAKPRTPGQAEMLLPIPGGKKAAATPAAVAKPGRKAG